MLLECMFMFGKNLIVEINGKNFQICQTIYFKIYSNFSSFRNRFFKNPCNNIQNSEVRKNINHVATYRRNMRIKKQIMAGLNTKIKVRK